MPLSIGIVGLPNVGKSTLFSALTRKQVPRENYPFCTIDPAVGVVSVPDSRLEALGALSKSEKTIPAIIEFTDIAGIVRGAAAGEGLGNQFLAHIREADAIAEVVRIFEDTNVAHVGGKIDPLDDVRTINTELALKDLETVEKRLASLAREVKAGEKEAVRERELLLRVEGALRREQFAKSSAKNREEEKMLKRSNLLTAKPVLYVLNKKNGGKNLDEMRDARYEKLIEYLNNHAFHYVHVDAAIEGELAELPLGESEAYRRELGAENDGITDLIRESYRLLGLITFFTTGPKETRAWTTRDGARAPEAGAAIHTDFREKFIRAEVISYEKLMEAGSFAAARDRGLLRLEGKEYTVCDGDVITFRI